MKIKYVKNSDTIDTQVSNADTQKRRQCAKHISTAKLISGRITAHDGSKFKAVNHRDKNFTESKMKARQKRVAKSIARYLAEPDEADRTQPSMPEAQVTGLQDKLTKLKEEMARLEALEKRMLNEPDKQLSLSDPDSRSMKTRGTGIVGYHVQAAVEAEHHLNTISIGVLRVKR